MRAGRVTTAALATIALACSSDRARDAPSSLGGAAGAPAGGGAGGVAASSGTGACSWGIGGGPPTCSDGAWSAWSSDCKSWNGTCAGAEPVCAGAPGTGHCAPCPDLEMVSVGDSCVDAMEVTRTKYAAWLQTSPSTTNQSSECSWNSSFLPDAACMEASSVCKVGCDDHPQVCVDWCDASAYCAATGKRLCGAYPAWAWTQAWEKSDAAELREACEGGTEQAYPYGSAFDPSACNGGELGVGTTVAVGSRDKCFFAHADGAIFDTSGNVAEWESACDGTLGPDDVCRTRGGGFLDSGVKIGCFSVTTRARADVASDVGFRCCGP